MMMPLMVLLMVLQKMKITFEHRRTMVLDGEKSEDVLTEFPPLKDVNGLVIKCLLSFKYESMLACSYLFKVLVCSINVGVYRHTA